MNLNTITLGYSPESGNIWLLSDKPDECRVINQEFYDTIEQVLHGKEFLKVNVRGKFYRVVMELA